MFVLIFGKSILVFFVKFWGLNPGSLIWWANVLPLSYILRPSNSALKDISNSDFEKSK